MRSSVQKFAEEFKAKGYPLHCLILNAGIFLTEHSMTPDGFEITQKTNHFGLVLLALLLVDVLKRSAPARIVWEASPAETFSGSIDWTDLKCGCFPCTGMHTCTTLQACKPGCKGHH